MNLIILIFHLGYVGTQFFENTGDLSPRNKLLGYIRLIEAASQLMI